jgi:hypothetical protein
MGPSKDLIARVNLTYLLADMLEGCMMEVDELARRETGQRLQQEAKRYYNAAIHNVRKMLKAMNTSSDKEQEDFGNDSDMLMAVLWLFIDRCGEDDTKAYRFYEYIKSFPSVCGLKQMDEEKVFGHIFSKKKLDKLK